MLEIYERLTWSIRGHHNFNRGYSYGEILRGIFEQALTNVNAGLNQEKKRGTRH